MPSSGGHYDAPHLARNAANFSALTPLSFLARAAAVYPDKLAVIHGDARCTYREFYARCRRLADALRRRGIRPGDTVAVMAPNVPALLEAHYGVPMAGRGAERAELPGSTPRSIAFILAHGAGQTADRRPRIRAGRQAGAGSSSAGRCRWSKSTTGPAATPLGGTEYEDFLGEGDPGADVAAARPTNGRRSRSTTPRARPAIPRASSITIAARF